MGGLHSHADQVTGPEATAEGLRAIRISIGLLAGAAIFQLAVVAVTGSVGLLAAGLDNLGDVLTTIALSVAFVASRRAADHKYTFGYQRLEDLGGVLVVLVIWAGAGIAAYEAYRKLVGHHEVTHIGLGIAAALVGVGANGVVAMVKIGVGKRIGSMGLIADGQHALMDSLASVAAFAGLIGAHYGATWADPVAAFVACGAIAFIAQDATRNVLVRLLDAVDPKIIEQIASVARSVDGVIDIGRVQARWAGRSLYVTLTVAVDGHATVAGAHDVGEHVHHAILHEIPSVAQVDVHVDPWEPHSGEAHDHTTAHAEPVKKRDVHDDHEHDHDPGDDGHDH